MTSIRSINLLLSAALMLLVVGGASAQTTDRIDVAGSELWISGANVAWVDFARDIGPGETRLEKFDAIFSELRAHGGNTMRLWLHTTGEHTPAWSGLNVTGPGAGAIDDLRAILDTAWEQDVTLLLALWSHDMLDNSRPALVTDRARAILTDEGSLQSYIDNALIPMVDSLRGHPAILAWEIFNEAEGFSEEYGWGSRHHVPMAAIQRFVNRAAGAIRRTDPGARVTTGTWKMDMLSDIGSFHNYYTDARLTQIGGDQDGYLDFYTVHYYSDFGSDASPFHHPFDHWELDKPLIVAEFFTEDTRVTVRNPPVPYDRLYESLYDRGYAGALAWQWFHYPESGEGATHWPRILANTQRIFDAHRDDVELVYPGLRASLTASRTTIERGQSTMLRWSTRDAEVITLNGVSVAASDSILVAPQDTTSYQLIAVDDEGAEIIRQVVIAVVDPAIINRAAGARASASSGNPEAATDGDTGTAWHSDDTADQWIYVDLGRVFAINRVVLAWDDAFGIEYDIDISYDARRWTTVLEVRSGQGGNEDLTISDLPEARFVRMRGQAPGQQGAGYSLTAFEVYGLSVENQPPTITLTSPEPGVFDRGEMLLAADVDTPGSVAYVVFIANGDSIGSATSEPYAMSWRPEPGLYEFRAVAYEENGRAGASQVVPVEVTVERQRVRYEVSSASWTGDIELISHLQASGESLLEMRDNGTITWSEIGIHQGGRFELLIGFRLPFDSPKTQHLRINGVHHSDIEFSGTSSAFLATSVDVDLSMGSNTVEIESDWGWMQFDYIEIVGDGQTVRTSAENEIAGTTVLGANYPNPFNPTTVVPYEISRPMHVRIEVFDVTGRRVGVVHDGYVSSGVHSAVFDASGLASGVYFYRMNADGAVHVRRMVLVK